MARLKTYYERLTDGEPDLTPDERSYIRKFILWTERTLWLTKSIRYLLIGIAGAWGIWLTYRELASSLFAGGAIP